MLALPASSMLLHLTGRGIFILAFATVSALSVVLFLVARSSRGLRLARRVSLLVIFLATAAAIWFDMLITPDFSEAEKLILVDATGTLLIAVALIPALPIQIFLLGVSVNLAFAASLHLASRWDLLSGEPSWEMVIAALSLDTLLCTALSAVNYQRLHSSHRSHHEVMRAQRLLLLTENAASMGRLAAVLSHELNNPLGSLKSSVATLKSLKTRLNPASEQEKLQLRDLEGRLYRTVDESFDRMEQVIGRMQRFTNLDRAEVRQVNLEDLLQDVILLFEPRFKVSGGRVATCNWNWFNARQIIREHGGDMIVISEASRTNIVISLPTRRT